MTAKCPTAKNSATRFLYNGDPCSFVIGLEMAWIFFRCVYNRFQLFASIEYFSIGRFVRHIIWAVDWTLPDSMHFVQISYIDLINFNNSYFLMSIFSCNKSQALRLGLVAVVIMSELSMQLGGFFYLLYVITLMISALLVLNKQYAQLLYCWTFWFS